MVGYREEECLRKLQEEQELLDAPANAECNAETTGECSTRTVQDSTDAGAPPVAAVAAPPPQVLDNGQQSGPSNANPTELEIALVNPNLRPEDREFAGSARFKNPKKMVLGNATTARYIPSSLRGQGTNIFAGNSAPTIGAKSTQMGQKASSNITGKRSTTSRRRYVPLHSLEHVYRHSLTH
jgi:hypothetical protein